MIKTKAVPTASGPWPRPSWPRRGVRQAASVGVYTKEERLLKIAHYRQKHQASKARTRSYPYSSRRNFAQSRPRIGGRFSRIYGKPDELFVSPFVEDFPLPETAAVLAPLDYSALHSELPVSSEYSALFLSSENSALFLSSENSALFLSSENSAFRTPEEDKFLSVFQLPSEFDLPRNLFDFFVEEGGAAAKAIEPPNVSSPIARSPEENDPPDEETDSLKQSDLQKDGAIAPLAKSFDLISSMPPLDFVAGLLSPDLTVTAVAPSLLPTSLSASPVPFPPVPGLADSSSSPSALPHAAVALPHAAVSLSHASGFPPFGQSHDSEFSLSDDPLLFADFRAFFER